MGTTSTNPTAASLTRLATKGYTEEFAAEQQGLRALNEDRVYRPEELVIEHVARIEQTSDPDSQCIIFGLRDASGEVAGTYCVPFGPAMSLLDAEMVNRLDNARGTRGVED